MKYDVLGDWMINFFCNFSCEYCYFSDDKRRQNLGFKGHEVEKIVDGFNKSGFVWLIHMSGGEPFLQPHFLELCRKLTSKHYISINTNLSTQDVYDFPKYVYNDKVAFIHCSLHIDERKRLGLVEDFIEKYHFLEKSGFNIYVTQVMFPPVLAKFDETFNFFKKQGIVVRPKIFRGYYHSKNYPENYNRGEKRRILKYIELCRKIVEPINGHIDTNLDEHFVDSNLSFKGQICSAGKDFVFIDYQGDVFRCQGDQKRLGNIFVNRPDFLKGASLCPAEISPCPYYCLKYAQGKYKKVRCRKRAEGFKLILKKLSLA